MSTIPATTGGVRNRLSLPGILLLVTVSAGAGAQQGSEPTYTDVAPIFGQRCVLCHSGQAAPAGLALDSLDAIRKGSTNGPVVVAGAPEDSELVRRVRGTSLPRMPMTGPPFLSDEEIGAIERWIAGGMQAGDSAAPLPEEVAEPSPPRAGEQVTYLHVAPILAKRCAKCHTDDGLMGPPPEGYRLDSYGSTLAVDDRARVVPGRPEASELFRRILGQARPRMPFDGPPYLGDEEIELIRSWIVQGAANAEGVDAPLPAGAKVRLHGTLESGHRLDGLELEIGSRTRIDKNPGAGDYVQVRGRLDAAGRVIVERLRRR